jgi:hypothetical protein
MAQVRELTAAGSAAEEGERAPGPVRRALRGLKKGWLRFAWILARVNTTILLTLIYFVIMAPVNLIVRLSRTDLLGRRIGSEKSFWQEPEGKCDDLEHCRRQF